MVVELVSGSSPFDVFCHSWCCCVCDRHCSERERREWDLDLDLGALLSKECVLNDYLLV